MDTLTLPSVPFGKYKGQSILTLLNDTNYLEWCKQQGWFRKYPQVYNICVNQTITNNQNSETPQHNQFQNLFLKCENVEKNYKDIHITSGETEFEGMFNWDLILKNYEWYLCECDDTVVDDDGIFCCDCEIYKKFREINKIPEHCCEINFGELYCEIKPSIGDDYTCVLRKMKNQMELTNDYIKKHNEKLEQEKKKKYQCDWELRRYWNKYEGSYQFELTQERIYPTYVLLINDFNSSTTTKEQLIKIFNQSRIKVVFLNELLRNVETKPTFEQVEDPCMIPFSAKEIQIEQQASTDNILEIKQKLLEAEDKIKQLQEELLSLKTKKKSKTMNDYFPKK